MGFWFRRRWRRLVEEEEASSPDSEKKPACSSALGSSSPNADGRASFSPPSDGSSPKTAQDSSSKPAQGSSSHTERDSSAGAGSSPRLSSKVWRWVRWPLLIFLSVSCLAAGGLAGWVWYLSRQLPDISSLKDYRPWRITKILAKDGSVAMELAHQRRTPIPIQQLPRHMLHAVLAAEDADFFKHKGLDYSGILRAFWKNLWRSKGAPKQGGSTITQQVVKTFFLSPKQVYTRKIKEAILARRLEKNLSKKEIIYLYLNQIYFGQRRYGIEEAARYYFGKSTTELSLSECAILAGVPKHPDRYNPAYSIRRTRRRRNHILRLMLRNSYITPQEYKKALAEEIHRPPPYHPPPFTYDYYTEQVRREALRLLEEQLRGSHPTYKERHKEAIRWLYRGGLTIETHLDPQAQRQAYRSLRLGLRRLDRRQGYRGPLRHLAPSARRAFLRNLRRQGSPTAPGGLRQALVLALTSRGATIHLGSSRGYIPRQELRWARQRASKEKKSLSRWKVPYKNVLRPGDVIWVRPLSSSSPQHPTFSLEQIPLVQGALVAIVPQTHRVRALVGGYHFKTSSFNRATQAQRQPGSVFKPILYGAALASHRYTAASLINDTYLEVFHRGQRWIPLNYNKQYSNRQLSLRQALTHSTNTVAVRVMDNLGPKTAIAFARKVGLQSPLTPYLSLALGASAVKPLEMVNAYATFAARGIYDQPAFISRITDYQGKTIYEHLPNPTRVIKEGVAYIVTSMMQDVVRYGTGRKAQVLGRPLAGKTGTTNEVRNAWFVGFTPDICAGVWIGYDDRMPLGPAESGGRAALPVFVDFMRALYPPHTPARPFPIPEDLLFVKIDPESGRLAPPRSSSYRFEAFLPGTQPTRYARQQSPIVPPEEFYRHSY